MPKSSEVGRTANSGGVNPVPVTVLTALPPSLVKLTTLLKLPADCGAKLTVSRLVWRAGMLKGLPDCTAKGAATAAEPERVRSPLLITWKESELVWPMMIEPKARLAGLTARMG